ncbi:MAG: TetR/AcrR family transcriptional regulator [Ignavibacteria bacterium]|nr:TetR/AcrR family transcriptional regulator [Ignavibacteria bacterium]
MGISERKERERQEMINLILDEAMKLFIEEGYENVTMRKIADRIEYSPTTIYLYFKDKTEIFSELLNIAFDKFYEAQMSVQYIEDAKEKLLAHGIAYVKFAVSNPNYYDLMFIMKDPTANMKCPDDWKTSTRTYDLLKKNIQECIENGYLEEVDIEVAAFTMWSHVHGIASIMIKRGFMIPEAFREYLIYNSIQYGFKGLFIK